MISTKNSHIFHIEFHTLAPSPRRLGLCNDFAYNCCLATKSLHHAVALPTQKPPEYLV